MRRFAVLAAMTALAACAPTRPPVEDGCWAGADPEERPVLTVCQWPSDVPLPAPPSRPAVAAREGAAPGTLVMPGHPDVFDHGPRSGTRVALTFDACTTTTSQFDERIIQTLVQHQVPATIFLGGRWAREHAEHVRAMAKNPLLELGNHSYTHPHLTWKTDDRIREELSLAQDEIASVSGVRPVLFRPPFGEYDDRVVRIARELGLRTVEYDLPSGDSSATADKLVPWVVGKAQGGSVVVMHINRLEFHTAKALPEIIAGLRARGFSFAKVSELMGGVGPAAMASASPVPRLPEEQLRDVRKNEAVQPAHLLVPVSGVKPLSASVEIGH